MKNLEGNKILAAVIIAGLIGIFSGKVAEVLYHEETSEKRGFSVEVSETGEAGGAAVEESAPVDIAAVMAAGNAENGAKLFKKCGACHTTEAGAHRVGPSLHAIVDTNKAHSADYPYSDAMKAKGGKWTNEDLYHFINKPKDFMPGTKMTFAGLKKPEDIADIVAYLKTQK